MGFESSLLLLSSSSSLCSRGLALLGYFSSLFALSVLFFTCSLSRASLFCCFLSFFFFRIAFFRALSLSIIACFDALGDSYLNLSPRLGISSLQDNLAVLGFKCLIGPFLESSTSSPLQLVQYGIVTSLYRRVSPMGTFLTRKSYSRFLLLDIFCEIISDKSVNFT